MTKRACVVGFDIPGIQHYVFAPLRPMDIMGGSLLLEDFAQDAERMANDLDLEVIYAGGGRGLFRVEDPERGAEFQRRVRARLEELTAGAAKCVTAAADAEGGFADLRGALAWELAQARASLWLDEPTETLIPAGTPPQRVCRACGLEVADHEDRVGSGPEQEREWIGEQCRVRRERGRCEGFSEIRELLGPDEDTLACVYLDADRLGATLHKLQSFGELATAAVAVREAVRRCRERASAIVGRSGLLTPVVGGDDLLIFCGAGRAPAVLEELWAELEQSVRLNGTRVSFSAALVVGPYALPLRLFFRTAQAALKQAKRWSYRTGEPHVQVESLMEGWLQTRDRPATGGTVADGAHDSRASGVFGGPLPRRTFWRDAPSIRQLVALINGVGRAQRAGLAEDLLHESAALRDLMLDQRSVHGEGRRQLEHTVAEARRLGEALHRCAHDLLLGGLAVATIWREA